MIRRSHRRNSAETDGMELAIPNLPMWEQIGGDVDAGGSGAVLAKSDGTRAIELLEIQPVRAMIGDREAADVGFPFWTKEAYFDLDDLSPSNKDVQSALDSIGMSIETLETDYEPAQRALVIAEALLGWGRGDEGSSGWSKDIIHEDVKWWGDKIAGAEYLEDEDEAFRDDILGYSEIREKLEEVVEAMADESSAQAWSTVDDQAALDAERDGFDPDSLIGIAEFGDAVGVNGDIETEKTLAGVESDLEKDGYEMLDGGGKVPSEEAMVSPEHAIQAVARDMSVDENVVGEAAKGFDWWPTSGSEEIASSTSGYAYIYGKRASQRPNRSRRRTTRR